MKFLIFLLGVNVIYAHEHVQSRPDCCLNELCPYNCVRCDGRATCYDLSDELGCHNNSDNVLKSYPKPPIFMPSVMETIKQHLLKQKKDLASTYPHRTCIQSSSAVQYGQLKQLKGTKEETPVWLMLLERLKSENGGSTTTTTTQTPVWLMLLERLKAELASRKTTTTTPKPTTTTEQSLLDLIYNFLHKKKAFTTTESHPTQDSGQLQIQATEKRTTPIATRTPATSTEQITKSTVLFSAADMATIVSRTRSTPAITPEPKPNTPQDVSLTYLNDNNDSLLKPIGKVSVVPKSPLDSIYSIHGQPSLSPVSVVKTVSQSNLIPNVTIRTSTLSADDIAPLQNITIGPIKTTVSAVSTNIIDTKAHLGKVSVTTPITTTRALDDIQTGKKTNTSDPPAITGKVIYSTYDAFSSTNDAIVTTQGVTGIPISNLGGVISTSQPTAPGTYTTNAPVNIENKTLDMSTESSNVSATGWPLDLTTFNNQTSSNSTPGIKESISQEIVTDIPRSITSTESYDLITDNQSVSGNTHDWTTDSSIVTDASSIQDINVTSSSIVTFNSSNLLKSVEVQINGLNNSDETIILQNLNKSTIAPLMHKPTTTEVAFTEVSGFRQTVASVTVNPSEGKEDTQKGVSPVKLFVNLSEISEMVYTSSNKSDDATMAPKAASRVITSLFSDPSSPSKPFIESKQTVEGSMRLEPRQNPSVWAAGSLLDDHKDIGSAAVNIISNQSLPNVKDSFREILANPNYQKVTQRPVQKLVSPRLPVNTRQKVETNENHVSVRLSPPATTLPDIYQFNMIPTTTMSSWWGATDPPFGINDMWGRTTTFPTTTSSWWAPTTVNSFWNSLFGYAPTTQQNYLEPPRTGVPVYPTTQRITKTPRPVNPPSTQSVPTQNIQTQTPDFRATVKLTQPTTPTPITFSSTEPIIYTDSVYSIDTSTVDYITKLPSNQPKTDLETTTPYTQTWPSVSKPSNSPIYIPTTSKIPYSIGVTSDVSTAVGTTSINTFKNNFTEMTTVAQFNNIYNKDKDNVNNMTKRSKENSTNSWNNQPVVSPTLAELRELYRQIVSQANQGKGTDIYNISTSPFYNETYLQSSPKDSHTFSDTTQTPIVTTTQEFVKPSDLSRNQSSNFMPFNWWHTLTQSTVKNTEAPTLSTLGSRSIDKPIISTIKQTAHPSSTVTTEAGTSAPSSSPLTPTVSTSSTSTSTSTSTQRSKLGNQLGIASPNDFASTGNLDTFVYELNKELMNRESRFQVLDKPSLSVTDRTNVVYNITEPPLAEWAVTSRYEPYRSTTVPNYSWWSKIISAVTEASSATEKNKAVASDTQTITYKLFKTTGSPISTQSTNSRTQENTVVTHIDSVKSLDMNSDLKSIRQDQMYVTTPTPVTQPIATRRECKLVMDGGEYCKLKIPGYYKNPDDCRTFFVCEWSNRFMCHCPPGTMFDTTIDVCNWDANVNC